MTGTGVIATRPAALAGLVTWFAEAALPAWTEHGFDRRSGQFVEALGLDGRPTGDPMLRVRSAARQIFVFAQAPAAGFGTATHLAIAEEAFERLHRAAWIEGPDPGYARVIDRFSGRALDETRDLYDNACVLLALAALHRATGRADYCARADRLLAAIDRTLGSPSGGWREDNLGTLPRRQNPHMHLFEACLLLAETTGDPAHLARLDAILALLERRFFHNGLLHEFFGPEWELAPSFGSHRLDPGHMSEWVWLLHGYTRLTGRPAERLARALFDASSALGPAGGTLLVDEVSAAGEPLRPCRRLWLQCEWLKACLARFDASGESGHLAQADAIAAMIRTRYLAETPTGTWRDNFDLDGRCIATAIPSSSLYHLWTAVAETVRMDLS